jgi:hypothetical protein
VRVVIFGSRVFDHNEPFYVKKVRDLFLRFEEEIGPISDIVSGLAKGPDMLGIMIGEKLGLPVHRFPPDWKKHGKGAGLIRNTQMGSFATVLSSCGMVSRMAPHMIDT